MVRDFRGGRSHRIDQPEHLDGLGVNLHTPLLITHYSCVYILHVPEIATLFDKESCSKSTCGG